MASTTTAAVRAAHRPLLTLTTTVAVLAAVVATLLGLWRVAVLFNPAYPFTVDAGVATPLDVSPRVAGAAGESWSWYSQVTVESHDPLTDARVLAAVAGALPFVLFVAACAVVVLLCRRLWLGRSFARTATWGLAALAALCATTAVVAPWAQTLSTRRALVALGYPTSGDVGTGPLDEREWVAMPWFDLGSVSWPLAALALLLVLVAVVARSGERLQRDTDGLV
ncbi:hypothetical protein V5D56_16440 [Cellulosimicrobium sp. PMB13]|uniref:hypothetical protein n=1 Tax=Cellulosimicrobium sp. PMB13 TaxID=3120158 RepID=UPI003F4C0055